MTRETVEIGGVAALYDMMRADLLRFLVARTGSRADADDLMQELWIRVQAAPAGPIGDGRAYLYRMAQNIVVDRLRERQRRTAREAQWLQTQGRTIAAADLPDASPTAEEALLDQEERDRLAAAIANLPDGARRVLELHKLQGRSHGDVAATLGISRSGVEKHMSVAMKHLRRILADWGER